MQGGVGDVYPLVLGELLMEVGEVETCVVALVERGDRSDRLARGAVAGVSASEAVRQPGLARAGDPLDGPVDGPGVHSRHSCRLLDGEGPVEDLKDDVVHRLLLVGKDCLHEIFSCRHGRSYKQGDVGLCNIFAGWQQ